MAHRGILRKMKNLRSTEPRKPRGPRAPEEAVYRILKPAPTLEEAIIGRADSRQGAVTLARLLRRGGAPSPLLIVVGTETKVFGTVVERITE